MPQSNRIQSVPVPGEATQAEIAQYCAAMLASLGRMAASHDMDLLAHLADLAHLEARRHF